VAGQKKVNKFKSQDSDSLKVDTLVIGETISVKELSEKTGINAAKLIGELMKNGILANINQQLDFETVSLVCSDFGIAIKKQEKSSSTSDLIS
ncbi:translation initiation factor IF-2 N-terminal domain-containing protein, partial [Salmonella enterica subsp. enterica]